MTTNQIIGTVIGVGAIIGIVYYFNRDTSKECFDLPTSPDPAVFGPKYWAAFHKIASDIPCTKCRNFGEKLMSYSHDLINKKLGKAIYDPTNFNYFNQSIASLNSGQDFNTAFNLS